jgi:adenylate cyclase
MEFDYTSQCLVCEVPLGGALGTVSRIAGIRRSRSNPNVCNRCNTHIEQGNVVDVTVFFADLSSFTELTHELGPERVSEVVDAFLQMATDVLVKHDAFIDKYIGDAVMAIFGVPVQHADHIVHAVAAALEIQQKMPDLRAQFALDLKARVSVASGAARVGQMGSRERKDYTAIGEAVNIAARLEGHAKAGEILLHDRVFDCVAEHFPATRRETLELKGFAEPVAAYRIIAEVDGKPVHHHLPHVDDRADRRRTVGMGSVIVALLSAPCAAGAALSPAALVIGAGSAFTTLQASFLAPLDQAFVRLPMQGLAVAGIAANMYTVWRARQSRKKAEAAGSKVTVTGRERLRTVMVIVLAVLTVGAILAEVYAHNVLMMP